MNDRLAQAGDPAKIADLAAVREWFEARWVTWNIVRALAAAGSFGCLIWALVVHGHSRI
ncbi:anthrone oxygenase family protein [Nonomuraea muscovyensis]